MNSYQQDLLLQQWPGAANESSRVFMSEMPEGEHGTLELEPRERYFQVLLESAVDIVTALNPDGTVLYCNPAISRVLGYDYTTSPGKKIFDFVHPDDLPIVSKGLDDAIRYPESVGWVEFRCRHQDGSWRDLEALSRNLLDQPGIEAIVVNLRDITDRKYAERKLVESQTALCESHEQLTILATRLLRVEEGELKRIARELHDDLNQQLAMLSFELDRLTADLPWDPEEIRYRLRQTEQHLGRLSEDVHRMAYQLHPSMLEELGLVAALRAFCNDLSRKEGIPIHFHHDEIPKHFPPDVALCIYRVTQEALRNVVKHSGAKHADVIIRTTPNGVRLCVHDSGKGFLKEQRNGLGLLSMEERTRLAGGRFSVMSEPGDGTIVEAEFPFRGVTK